MGYLVAFGMQLILVFSFFFATFTGESKRLSPENGKVSSVLHNGITKTENTSNSREDPVYHPTPSQCLTKDNSPVEVDGSWHESCEDNEGNSYLEGDSLMSCCGCFKYVCTKIHVQDNIPAKFIWTRSVSTLCCQTCNGTVVPAGTVVGVEVMGDECGTVKTSICKIRNRVDNDIEYDFESHTEQNLIKKVPNKPSGPQKITPAAAIENEYHYQNCCSDESGLHQLNQIVPDVSTCSTRMCKTQDGWVEAAWVNTQHYPGCCEVEGKLVPDGFSWTVETFPVQTWECCKGKIVMVQQPLSTILTTETTSSTTSRTTTTFNQTIPCEKWLRATGKDLYSLALRPSMIGDTNTEKRCQIIDAKKCETCACDFYVRYSEDGGSTWLGLSFQGEPGLGGTGCPGYGMTQATWDQALDWLKDKHIDKGRCGCVH